MATAAKQQQQQTTVIRSVSVSQSSSSSQSNIPTSLPLQQKHSPTTDVGGGDHQHIPKIHHIYRSTSPLSSQQQQLRNSSPISPSSFGNSISKLPGSNCVGGGVNTVRNHYIQRSTTTTPQQSPTTTTSSSSSIKKQNIESDDEIESIAKQISDHAEAIYQTWKARGLAPTEFLNTSTTNNLDNNSTQIKFSGNCNKILQPPNIRNNLESPVVEFLSNTPNMSNNNLEKLVSSFVNEDKARQQAAKKIITPTASQQNSPTSAAATTTSILTSGTIRDALKKFEGGTSNGSSNNLNTGNNIGYIKPNFLISKGYTTSTTTTPTKQQQQQQSNLLSQQNSPIISQSSGNIVTTPNKISSPTSQLSKSVPDVLIDTINTQQQQQQQKQQLKSPKNNSPNNTTTSIISGGVGLTKTQQKQLQNNKNNSSNSVPVLIGGRQSPTTTITTKQLLNNIASSSDDIDSKLNSSISNNCISNSNSGKNTGNSINNKILNSNTTSITSNIISKNKPQTPAKPANLLNHQPVWPNNKSRPTGGSASAGGGSGSNATTPTSTNISKNISSSVAATTTPTSPAAIKILKDSSSPTATTAATNIISKNSSSSSSNNSNISSNSKLKQTEQHQQQQNSIISSCNKLANNSSIGGISSSSKLSSPLSSKKSSDLLDEVIREEERLINALKTGIVLNNNQNNHHNNLTNNNNNNNLINDNTKSLLPEVIQSTLNNHIGNNSSVLNKKSIKSSSPITTSITTTSSNLIKSEKPSSPIKSSTTIPIAVSSGTTTASTTKKCTNNEDKLMEVNAASTATTNNQSTVVIVTKNSSSPTLIGNTSMSPAPAPIIKTTMRPKNNAAVPHPEQKSGTISLLSNYTNSRTNNTILNPVRPFLTRGSVAERVMMFEKCPDVKAPMRNINREPLRAVKIHSVPKPEPQSHTTLQRAVRASNTKNVYIPRFHYPHGKPIPNIAQETIIQCVKCKFDSFPNNLISKEDFPQILKICGLPFYWRMPFIACTQIMAGNLVDGYRFVDFWKQMSIYCHDIESRFVYILSRGQRSRPYILPEDLAPLVQDVVDTHPGLAFLKEASEFHSRYVHTVIARIFYSVNRSWSGRITVAELRRSNLIQVIQLLEEEEDINQIMAFFSYEHFYVIYCKFWELDRDHDLFIDQNDLARHNDHALSTRIIERIFSGCVTRGGKSRIMGPNGPKMSYTDFVWFLLSEEDKTNPTSIEYWFRCMDLDGDGIISMYELEYFYEEQQQRMESIGIETLPYEDCLCQMLDMIKPARTGCVTLTDLKRCKMTPIFFDTFFNLEKYLEHEQRDPFASQRDNEEMSDWDRYAAQEYELLVAEEGGDTQGSYEEEEDDDYESNIDILESQIDDMSNMINEW